jgi:molybdopterin-containing oxidoreductase family membrane subunit
MDAASVPYDHALFPEGTKRCQLKWFLLWIAALNGPLMVGVIATVMCWGLALNVTYLNNNYPFGLWIAADLGIIALGAGAFFTGFLRYIIKIDELKHIVNFAVIIGVVCYAAAQGILGVDIGQPLRGWFIFWQRHGPSPS